MSPVTSRRNSTAAYQSVEALELEATADKATQFREWRYLNESRCWNCCKSKATSTVQHAQQRRGYINQAKMNGNFFSQIFATIIFMLLFVRVSTFQTSSLDSEFQEHMQNNFLKHLDMKEIPTFTREEFLNFEVPSHVRRKYESLVWKRDAKMGFQKVLERSKRSSSGPSLAGLFKSVHKKPGITGDIVYSDTFHEMLQFDMEGRIPDGSVITIAQLRLFKKLPNFNRRLSSFSRFRSSPSTNSHHDHNTASWRPAPVRHARVSVYHTLTHADGSEESLLIDSRMIMVNGSGWHSFDITKAVKQWQKHPVKFMSITLELRVEGSRPGRVAAEIARMVRFTGQRVASESPRRPELVVFTEEEEEIKTNDCKARTNNKRQKCCREEHYVNFREMEWTQYWIIEPSGYDAYKCAGRCSDSHRRSSPGAPRSCTVAESAPLPVMYLVKRADITQVEISEFPNMIVKKCGCSLDSVFVV